MGLQMVFVLVPMQALVIFPSLPLFPVKLQRKWSFCECCVIFCPAQSQWENAHLACKSQPCIDASLALYWVAVLCALHTLSVDCVTSCWKPPVAPPGSHRGTFTSSLKCNVCYLKCTLCGPQKKNHSFLPFHLFIFPV